MLDRIITKQNVETLEYSQRLNDSIKKHATMKKIINEAKKVSDYACTNSYVPMFKIWAAI